jgi:hypothetical protein
MLRGIGRAAAHATAWRARCYDDGAGRREGEAIMRRHSIGCVALAALVAATPAHTAAAAGEADARKLIAAARGHVLVVTWSPLNRMLIDLKDGGRMSVIGTGLRHCDGPHPGGWQIRDGRLCLSTPWSAPCFEVSAARERYELKDDAGRAVYADIEDGPLGRCATSAPEDPRRGP